MSQKRTIIFADNDADAREVYGEVLREKGDEVKEASSYSAAEKLLAEVDADFGVFDIRMKDDKEPSDISGLKLARAALDKQMPAIILTGSPTLDVIKENLHTENPATPLVEIVDKKKGANGLRRAVRKFRERSVPRFFLAHGHDNKARDEVKQHLAENGCRVIVLQDQVGATATIIEKFEASANVHGAVILVTPDDRGGRDEKPVKLKPRARQNVIFEFGYLIGKLGRQRVVVLHKGIRVELPSDCDGMLRLEMDAGGHWRDDLSREIERILALL